MWRELIKKLSSDAEIARRATPKKIAAAEQSLGVKFPEELVSVLLEADGVMMVDETGADIVWSCERIVEDNLQFRNDDGFKDLYMPFDHLLFFGDEGGGDQFAYAIKRGVVRAPANIYIWDHEDDSRTAWAFSMQQYLQKALAGDDGEPDWDNM